jgi:hypothetical protein
MKRKVNTYRLIDGSSMNAYSIGQKQIKVSINSVGVNIYAAAESVVPIEFYELETGEIRIRKTGSPTIHLLWDKVIAVGEHGEFDEDAEGESDEDTAVDIVGEDPGLRPVD